MELSTTPYQTNDDAPPEHWMQQMRIARDLLLQQSDWSQLPDAPVDSAAWAIYRQQLRDAPATWTPGPTWDPPEPPA